MQIDEEDFCCVVCGFGGDPEKQSPYFKKQIAELDKDREKYKNFPEKQLANLVNTLKARSPESVELFNSFIHNTDSEKAIGFVNLLRGSKLYKSYPKSLTDDEQHRVTISK